MTPNGFRELALILPEAIESAHMHHPDFRVGGRIFATLGYPDEHSAMVKLSPDDQKEFIRHQAGRFHTGERCVEPARRHKYQFAGGDDQHRARSAHRSMAQHRAQAAIEKPLTQAHGFANRVP